MFHILPQYIFRRSNPLIVGVKVVKEFKIGMNCYVGDRYIGIISDITDNNIPLDIAEEGKEVAVAIKGAILGRNILETDTVNLHQGAKWIGVRNATSRD